MKNQQQNTFFLRKTIFLRKTSEKHFETNGTDNAVFNKTYIFQPVSPILWLRMTSPS